MGVRSAASSNDEQCWAFGVPDLNRFARVFLVGPRAYARWFSYFFLGFFVSDFSLDARS
jgi:hypothetical protein